MKNKTIGRLFLTTAVALLLTACGSEPVYEEEAFTATSPYQRQIRLQVDEVCEGVRLALLSQGYVVDAGNPLDLKAVKAFQPKSDEHATIEFRVVCALHQGWATVYASAMEARYELKKTSDSLGFSLPSVGSLSLPFGSNTHSLVKVGGKTITDEAFYKRFFDLVEGQLGLIPQPKADSKVSKPPSIIDFEDESF